MIDAMAGNELTNCATSSKVFHQSSKRGITDGRHRRQNQRRGKADRTQLNWGHARFGDIDFILKLLGKHNQRLYSSGPGASSTYEEYCF